MSGDWLAVAVGYKQEARVSPCLGGTFRGPTLGAANSVACLFAADCAGGFATDELQRFHLRSFLRWMLRVKSSTDVLAGHTQRKHRRGAGAPVSVGLQADTQTRIRASRQL
jgi:hypothetical protein